MSDTAEIIFAAILEYVFPFALFFLGIFLLLARAEGGAETTRPVPLLPERWVNRSRIAGGIIAVIALIVLGIQFYSNRDQSELAAIDTTPTDSMAFITSSTATPYPTYTPLPTYTPYAAQVQNEAATVIPPPTVSILSLSYRSAGWKPRVVDLRMSDQSGVPIYPNAGLRLFDLWVDISENCIDCTGVAEVYADGEFIGGTEKIVLHTGKNEINSITPKNYISGQDEKEWMVQPVWKTIDLIFLLYAGDQMVDTSKTEIQINMNGNAWFISPPVANIAEFSYQINGGEEMWIDWRTATTEGITVSRNDKLQIMSVWYKAHDVFDKSTLVLELQLFDENGSITGTYQSFGNQPINNGIHLINTSTLKDWQITEETRSICVIFSRLEDGVVLDDFEIPLKIQN